ncbi:MAG: glycosyltransferase family 4 protein [Acidobacteria bacterium]|nr:glycosyltransferase family 4 protein [Acidobacteriota bacterium]
MPIKVANITVDGRFGGPQHRILQTADALRPHGIQTLVILPAKESEVFYSKLVARGLPAMRLRLHGPSRRVWRLLGHIASLAPEILALRRVLRQEQVDVVHCNGVWQLHGVVAGRLAGARVVLHLNDTWTYAWTKLLFFLVRPLCDAFIVTGRRVRASYFAKLPQTPEGKTIVEIQAPVDTSRFDPDRVTADPKLAKATGITISTVGTINPEKGLEYFLAMVGILTKRYGDLAFYIVGSPLETQRAYFRRLLDLANRLGLRNVEFYGSAPDVAPILKATDIFVCSSVSESGPMSVWEAMAMRKAVVSTDVGDVAVYIRNGENGFVVRRKDPEALAEKVGALIDDRDLRAAFGRRARETAVRELDLGVCVEKYRQFYEAVARPRGASSGIAARVDRRTV